MNKITFDKTEVRIIAFLWLLSLSTYPYALLNNYVLSISNYLGVIGLIITTVLISRNNHLIFKATYILLLLGLFNLLSFGYFINFSFSFWININIGNEISIPSPGIQLVSLVLITILSINRSDKLFKFYSKNVHKSSKDVERTKNGQVNHFKQKFSSLSEQEIKYKLELKLTPEAIQALNEILLERERLTTSSSK